MVILMRNYLVRVIRTRMFEYEIEAKDEEEAGNLAIDYEDDLCVADHHFDEAVYDVTEISDVSSNQKYR